jgi:hypothetical protein
MNVISTDAKSPPWLQHRFEPVGLLRNRHVQSMLASAKFRKLTYLRQKQILEKNSQELLLQGGDNVVLHALYSPLDKSFSKSSKGVVVLIHGWEGSAQSVYLLSAATRLYTAGYDVVRLHLRDHGPSHHLNRELFHAARLSEVVTALHDLQQKLPQTSLYLAGFSLGGNFVLRVASVAQSAGLRFAKYMAVSPVADPLQTYQAIEEGADVYHRYFVKKWKRSLRKKQKHFPDLISEAMISKPKNLGEMTDSFVRHHTEFGNKENYFEQYKLTSTQLSLISAPTLILVSKDDPVIPYQAFLYLSENQHIYLSMQNFGGHCGFVSNWSLHSYTDELMLQFFQ